MKNFKCFNTKFSKEMIDAFKDMQKKYIFKKEYMLSFNEVDENLSDIKNKILKYN